MDYFVIKFDIFNRVVDWDWMSKVSPSFFDLDSKFVFLRNLELDLDSLVEKCIVGSVVAKEIRLDKSLIKK